MDVIQHALMTQEGAQKPGARSSWSIQSKPMSLMMRLLITMTRDSLVAKLVVHAGKRDEHRSRREERPPSGAKRSGCCGCARLVRLDDVTERHQVDEQGAPRRIAQRRGELRGIERVVVQKS